jgi:hypothetical protein
MEEMQNQDAPKMSSIEEEEELEISHTDKLVGVFAEPVPTFEKMAKFPPKTIDWILPVIVVIVVAVLSNIVMMSNPDIRLSVMEKQMKNIEKNFDEMVTKGQMTETQKNEQMDAIRDRMSEQGMLQYIISGFGILVFTFIVFFIVSGVFLLIAKFGLKGEGTYKSAMVAYGLPYYISVLQVIVMVILAMVMNRFFTGTSVGAFMDADGSTISGWLLNKLDPFTIWFFIVSGIGFAKMFKSDDIKKYILMMIGVWLLTGLGFFYLAQAVPFLKWFGM